MPRLDNILGRKGAGKAEKDEPDVLSEILSDALPLDYYRPYLTRPRAQLMFSLIERTGRTHVFQYHALRHPIHEMAWAGWELLSFIADGCSVVMEGRHLRVLVLGLMRAALVEMREEDGQPPKEGEKTTISRLEVSDPQARTDGLRPTLSLVQKRDDS